MDNVKALSQYPTPLWVAEALIDRHFPELDASDMVIEPSCGYGSFLSGVPAEVPALGVEIDVKVAEQARMNTGREIIVGDFLTVPLHCTPTLIVGNPPFNLKTIDGFLDRAHELLPEGGRVGFILPAYAFQTAARVVGYSQRWSMFQEMIPRNVYPGLSKPLIFAILSKDRQRTMVGFALYQETTDLAQLGKDYRAMLTSGSKTTAGSVWRAVVTSAIQALGGESDLGAIYAEVEKHRPTANSKWKEKIRQTVRRYEDDFVPNGKGRYRLADQRMAA